MRNLTTYSNFLNEGRYDRISGKTVDRIWKVIKLSKVAGDKEYTLDLGEISDGKVFFHLIVSILRAPVGVSQGFVIGAGAYTEKNENSLGLEITIDPKKEPKSYQKMNAKLQDAVRHEIEHMSQAGINKVPGKPTATRIKSRSKISVDNKNLWKYFLLRDEVPAMVQGMYRQAKTEKRKLDDVFNEYLDYFVGEKLVSKSEKQKIMDVWIKYAKAHVPAAQYSK